MVDVAAYLEAHAAESVPLRRLAALTGYSPSHLQRAFKRAFGVSPKQYQDAARVKKLKTGLRTGAGVTQASAAAGYGSSSRLHARVDGNLGMTPSAYRAGGAGEMIRHACRDTTLGSLMMAATERGVCFVQFGDSRAALQRQLEAEFPAAQLQASAAEGSADLDDWMRALEQHLDRNGPCPDLPLDLRGTAFQLQTWRFLMQIPRGGVISYTELAEGLGRPRAVRAAATACARNRVAVLVPCHRVLRSDGSLGGYRWGLERKRALLDRERAAAATDPVSPKQ